ncbi:MAG TPA: hypothetical protein VET88_04735 [Gammaproteobacteria bacterium]|nr:hypothetical protein [Gammaproteobacteria bacterium]
MGKTKDEDMFPGRPGIATAIPKRRYRLGEFTLIVLGDIESRDGINYRYIMAVIRGEDPEPGIYITAEQGGGEKPRDLDMRFIMRDGSEVISSSARWSDLDDFVGEATGVVVQVLNLSDETPYRLS